MCRKKSVRLSERLGEIDGAPESCRKEVKGSVEISSKDAEKFEFE